MYKDIPVKQAERPVITGRTYFAEFTDTEPVRRLNASTLRDALEEALSLPGAEGTNVVVLEVNENTHWTEVLEDDFRSDNYMGTKWTVLPQDAVNAIEFFEDKFFSCNAVTWFTDLDGRDYIRDMHRDPSDANAYRHVVFGSGKNYRPYIKSFEKVSLWPAPEPSSASAASQTKNTHAKEKTP